jgi:hypothetical protein
MKNKNWLGLEKIFLSMLPSNNCYYFLIVIFVFDKIRVGSLCNGHRCSI